MMNPYTGAIMTDRLFSAPFSRLNPDKTFFSRVSSRRNFLWNRWTWNRAEFEQCQGRKVSTMAHRPASGSRPQGAVVASEVESPRQPDRDVHYKDH
jgi:hypothetical protein